MGFARSTCRPPGLTRAILILTIVMGLLWYYQPPPPPPKPQTPPKAASASASAASSSATPLPPPPPRPSRHPIDDLIETAGASFRDTLHRQTHGLAAAAAQYRARRGRHPPPGFDVWYQFAEDRDAVMVEDFFDQIYHDLNPFWGLPPAVIRREASDFGMTIKVRNHTASAGSDWFWTEIWLDMLASIEHMLPDMDLPLNSMDEPRVVAPWEEVDRLMARERQARSMPPADEVVSDFRALPEQPDVDVAPRDRKFTETRPFWQAAIRGCPPSSLARKAAPVLLNGQQPPTFSPAHAAKHTYEGFVANFTLSTDFCHQPDLQALHGMMIAPISVSESRVFSPIFGGSKLPTNNDILLPAPMYWDGQEKFTGGGATGSPWAEKLDKAIWRGVATGGASTAENWRGFQRHRFVAMSNGTKVLNAASGVAPAENWAMPDAQYHLAAEEGGQLGEWIEEWADAGFVDLMCISSSHEPPLGPDDDDACDYTKSRFEIVEGVPLSTQFDFKYLPDIDGNSFSGRYRAFLMSTSLPMKATLFREWHDSRLVPWVHFVPMDNRFMDFYGIMEYFVGYKGKGRTAPAHDEQAQKIASAGQEWANKVLRREDMQIYVLRLLLEYARLTDDRREKMGFVDDLLR